MGARFRELQCEHADIPARAVHDHVLARLDFQCVVHALQRSQRDRGHAAGGQHLEDEYVHASGVRLPKPPPRTFSGRWIDVDLSEPAMLAAYEGDQLVYATLTIKGTAVDPTPLGVHTIQRRVANEIMDSATVGIPRNSPRGYYLTNVLYTQYFTGAAPRSTTTTGPAYLATPAVTAAWE